MWWGYSIRSTSHVTTIRKPAVDDQNEVSSSNVSNEYATCVQMSLISQQHQDAFYEGTYFPLTFGWSVDDEIHQNPTYISCD